jgi:iron complex outermembrane recepter protein
MFRILSAFVLLTLFSTPVYSQTDSVRRTEGGEVIVTGFPGEEGITPVPMEEIKLKKIEEQVSITQPAKVASFTPSANFYSQSGTEVGYTFLSIRGFEQRRLSILVNGVPQNDPEDHNVYWIDMPDLLGSTGRINIQRGAGSAFYGPPAIGGSINVETEFPAMQALNVSAGFGSYNTLKYAIEGSSGLFADNWMAHARLSRTTTDGYRNAAFVELNSYYLSLKRVSESHILQFNAFGGPIKDGLDYYGIYPWMKEEPWTTYAPAVDVNDPKLRKYNLSDSYAGERRPEEVERFFQPHYEVMSTYFIDPVMTLKNTFFYVQGDGEFDFDGTWTGYTAAGSAARYFRLTQPYADLYGFRPVADTVFGLGNELIRAYVGNKQFGWLPRFEWKVAEYDFYLGAEIRRHRSTHWGSLLSADSVVDRLPSDYHYYEYNAGKDIISPYAALTYRFGDGLTVFGSVQAVTQKYLFENEKPFYVDSVMAQGLGLNPGWRSHDFEVGYFFVNPRAGLGLDLSKDLSAFVSFGLTSREPRLGEYYKGESFSEPNFERLPSGNYNYNSPRVKPERLMDLEAGLSTKTLTLSDDVKLKASLNGYYMKFDDELVKTGEVDLFGSSVTGNAQETEHLGVEGGLDLNVSDNFSFEFNGAVSKHRFVNYVIDSTDFSGQVPIGFPDLVMSGIVSYQLIEPLRLSLLGRYVGSTYGDLENTETYRNPDYFVMDAVLTMKFPLEPLKSLEIKIQANNIFDRLYTTYADVGSGFFVAAPRHFFGTITIGI